MKPHAKSGAERMKDLRKKKVENDPDYKMNESKRINTLEKKKKSEMSPAELADYKRRKNENLRRFRAKKKMEKSVHQDTSQNPGFKSRSSLGAAVNRLIKNTPKSPSKKLHAIKELSKSVGLQIVNNLKLKDSTPNELELLVKEFYFLPNIVYTTPGMQDEMAYWGNGKKETLRKYYLMMPLKEVYALFCERYPGVKIGLSKFSSLRPVNVLLMKNCPLDQCKCIHHENFRLKLSALGVTVDSNFWSGVLCNDKNLSSECWNNLCENCKSGQKIFADDGTGGESSYSVTWYEWIKIQKEGKSGKIINRYEKVTREGFIGELKEIVLKELHLYQSHVRVKRSMDSEFQKDRDSGEAVVMQIDFAMDYNCMFNQNEISSAIYSRGTVTIFTCAFYFLADCKSYAVITDADKYKDSIRLFCTKLIEEHNLEDGVPFIIYSDGPRTEFKNKYMVYYLMDMSSKLNRAISWKFFATGHGKGVCDGIGGASKSRVREHSIAKGKEVDSMTVTDYHSFFEVASKVLPAIKYLKLGKEDVLEFNVSNPISWDKAIPVPKISEMHVIYANADTGVVNCWRDAINTNNAPDVSFKYPGYAVETDFVIGECTKKPLKISKVNESNCDISDESIWKQLLSPDVIGRWYATIYYSNGIRQSKKAQLYVGKIVNKSCEDSVIAFEMKCLKPYVGAVAKDAILDVFPEHLVEIGDDMATVPIYDIIYGPVEIIPIKGNKIRVQNYDAINLAYKNYLKMDRCVAYNSI